MKLSKVLSIFKIFIISIFMTLDVSNLQASEAISKKIGIDNNNLFEKIVTSFSSALNGNNVIYGVAFFIALIFLYNKNINKSTGIVFNIVCGFLSTILSLFVVIGISFRTFGNSIFVFSSLDKMAVATCFLIGFSYFLYLLFKFLLNCVHNIDLIQANHDKQNSKNNLFLKYMFIMLLCWLPYVLVLYPGTTSYDTLNQLTEFFGHGDLVRNVYPISHYLVSDTTFSISNQHNFILTFFYGSVVKLSLVIFKSASFGIFLLSLVQLSALAAVNTYGVIVIKKYTNNLKYTKILMLTYSFFPFFPIFGMYLVKNVIYAILIQWLMIQLLEWALDDSVAEKKRWVILLAINVFLELSVQKYAIYVIIIVAITAMFIVKKSKFKFLIAMISPIIIFKLFITGFLFTNLNVVNGDPIESYSIPFQQTALYLKKYPNGITKNEKHVLNKVFYVNNLADLYNPKISDPIKSSGDKNIGNKLGYRYQTVTQTDLQKYRTVWTKMLVKHPEVYLQAYLNLCYGYLDIGQTENYTSDAISNDNLPLVSINYVVPSNLTGHKKIASNFVFGKVRHVISIVFNIFVNIYPAKILLNGIFYVVVSLLAVLAIVYRKKYKYLLAIMPLLIQIPILMASPVNGSQRYMLPFILCIMVTITILLMSLNNTKKSMKVNK